MRGVSRRTVLAAAPLLAIGGRAWAEAPDLDAVERASGGRLGVCVVDTGSGALLQHRGGERFPMCSTFKALAVGCLLSWVDAGRVTLAKAVPYGKADLLSYAPITSKHLAEGAMSLGDICAAAITYSDNTAANLILGQIGGPAGLTAWLRGIGDATTRLDRTEPTLNTAVPGDPRDTTTPLAVAASLQQLTLGAVLKPASRDQLNAWLAANTTGAKKLRAGLPPAWQVGDKTGSGGNNTGNDIAVIRPPGRAPLIAAVFVTGASSDDAADAAVAAVGGVIAHWTATHG